MSKQKNQTQTILTIFTMGFKKKAAKEFYSKLKDEGVKRVIDVRLNNTSHLAGFTKRDKLSYFLNEIAGIDYIHLLELAPTKEIFDSYKNSKIDWQEYEQRFLKLLQERRVENIVIPEELNGSCLLCSEPEPDKCHRRLVAEYFRDRWGNVEIKHL